MHIDLVGQVQDQVALLAGPLVAQLDRLELERQVVAERTVQPQVWVLARHGRDHLPQGGEDGGAAGSGPPRPARRMGSGISTSTSPAARPAWPATGAHPPAAGPHPAPGAGPRPRALSARALIRGRGRRARRRGSRRPDASGCSGPGTPCPELSTPPRSPSTCVQMVSRTCSSIGSAVLVTSTPPAVTVCVSAVRRRACRLVNLVLPGPPVLPGSGPGLQKPERPPRPGGGLLDVRCARASHRLTGGATTGGDCWFAWREPTGAPWPGATPARRSRVR